LPVAKKLQGLAIWPVPPFKAVFPDLAPYLNVAVSAAPDALDVVLDATATATALEATVK